MEETKGSGALQQFGLAPIHQQAAFNALKTFGSTFSNGITMTTIGSSSNPKKRNPGQASLPKPTLFTNAKSHKYLNDGASSTATGIIHDYQSVSAGGGAHLLSRKPPLIA